MSTAHNTASAGNVLAGVRLHLNGCNVHPMNDALSATKTAGGVNHRPFEFCTHARRGTRGATNTHVATCMEGNAHALAYRPPGDCIPERRP